MRKKPLTIFLLIVILLLTSLVACKGKKVEDVNEEPIENIGEKSAPPIVKSKEDIMKDFRNIVKSDNEPFIISKFIDENIENVEEEDAIQMVVALEEVQEEYLNRYTDQLFVDNYQIELIKAWETESEAPLFFEQSKIQDIEDGNLKELVEKIYQGKYKLITMEGSFYPIIDYEAMESYSKYISEETKDYFSIKSMDSNMPAVLDAGIVISFDELAERLIKTEEYIKKYPEGLKYEEVLRLYGVYLRFYLGGIDNSPIFDYDTNLVLDEVLSSYKKTANKKDTIVSQIVGKYVDIIEDNEKVIDNEVLSKITGLHSEAISLLEKDK